jgi:hypothetical protein
MPARWQSYFFLCKRFDFASYDVYTTTRQKLLKKKGGVKDAAPFIRSVQLQHALFICIPKKLVCEAVDARSFAYTWHALWFKVQAASEREKAFFTEIIRCGQFPSLAITLSLSIVSWLPTMSSSTRGRYFSTL